MSNVSSDLCLNTNTNISIKYIIFKIQYISSIIKYTKKTLKTYYFKKRMPMFLINQKENLNKAIENIDRGHTYQALDIIQKHLKEIIETTNPTLTKIRDSINEYHQYLLDSKELLEKSTRETIDIESNIIEEAKNKINNAIHTLGTIEECCKTMTRCKEKLQ